MFTCLIFHDLESSTASTDGTKVLLMSIGVESSSTRISGFTVRAFNQFNIRCGGVTIDPGDPVLRADMSVTHPIEGEFWDWIVGMSDAEISSGLLGDELRGCFVADARSAIGILYIQPNCQPILSV